MIHNRGAVFKIHSKVERTTCFFTDNVQVNRTHSALASIDYETITVKEEADM